MMEIIKEIIIFAAPCWAINAALNLFKFIPGINKIDHRLDFGKNFFDQRPLFGPSTTIVGLPVAILSGAIINLLITGWKLGILAGITVYFGHAVGSFIKRRLNIPSGNFFPLVDHGDYVILTGLTFLIFGKITWLVFLFGLALTLAVHPILCYIGFRLRLRDQPL